MRFLAILLCLGLAAAHPQPYEGSENPEDPDIDHMIALLGEGILESEGTSSSSSQLTEVESSEASYFISTGGDRIKEITVAEAGDYGLTCMPAGALSQSADVIVQETVDESAAAASASDSAAASSAATGESATSASAGSVGAASSAAAGGAASSAAAAAGGAASSAAAGGDAASSSAAGGDGASSAAAAGGDAASSAAAAGSDAASSAAASGDAASSAAAGGDAASSAAAAGDAASAAAAGGDAASSAAAGGDAASSAAAGVGAASSAAAAGDAASAAAAGGDAASSAAAGGDAASSAAAAGSSASSASVGESSSSSSQLGYEIEEGEEGYEEYESVGECVPYYLCNEGDIVTDGAGIINIRFGASGEESKSSSKCPNFLDVFCRVPLSEPVPDILEELIDYDYEPSCGHRNPEGVGILLEGFVEGESQFGEAPWMGIVLEDELLNYDQVIQRYVCGASLIHPQVVMTAAHCIYGKDATKLTVRLGDWDTQNEKEIFPYETHRVASMETHERFNSANLRYDVGLLFLEEPVELKQHIDTICLPTENENFDYATCIANGYGKDQFHGGRFQNIMKQVSLPVVPHRTCQNRLRETRLGSWFRLHRTFTCAGGEAGVDTCRGDGGSPFVCPSKEDPNKYVQVGIVAWGIGCGEDGVPGVYASVPKLVKWVKQKMGAHGFGAIQDQDGSYKHAPPV